ncbi:MAG: four helix bundle protein [Planctomycetes bacterium]|nr:four helix bundle protein [Planctomycetota bacterium]
MSRIQGDLKERTFHFARQIVELVDTLPKNIKGWEIGKQLIRSGCGVGANVREADNAHTASEFAYKCSIARKEAAETNYWIDLAICVGLVSGGAAIKLREESDELTRILSSIVRKTQSRVADSAPEQMPSPVSPRRIRAVK